MDSYDDGGVEEGVGEARTSRDTGEAGGTGGAGDGRGAEESGDTEDSARQVRDPDSGLVRQDGSLPQDAPEPEDAPAPQDGLAPPAVPRTGIAALSLPYQVVAAVALAVLGVFACVHLGMVFLHVAPSNTLTKQHGEAVDDWVYPEFEQNWKLFAPNPLQQNVAVQVRAQVAGDGGRRTTGWIDLTGQDAANIRGSLLPSHTEQNELRRAWDFYLNSHTDDHRPNGLRGELSESYMRRIVMRRLDERELGGTVQRVQLRSVTRPVPAPSWSGEKTDTKPVFRSYPWWRITDPDRPAGAAGAEARSLAPNRTEAGR
ncbi:DUF5819 family protein [Streptomyces sp. NBC_01268]|uniref:DUF5819 family protein n=1 Tax=Streptomyces sp. NBC_01268 TaxID=2903806 RepID=UPI002E3246D2|nr:DUF5819 family protein [Streptomyces sp. NBC_01268]